MRVQRRCIVNADRDTVWRVVSDPDRYPEFMTSLERWEVQTEGPVRVGARYTVHWKIGSVPIGGVVEVVEFDPGRDLAWLGLTGVTLRGRFRLREAADHRTKVEYRMAYEAPGGILGLIADRVAARQVGRNMSSTLKNLKTLVER